MVIPKNIFLFFFCNYQGRAYFLDSNGNVQLGNIASGQDYSLPDSPSGWLEQQLSWARNQKYLGFNRAFSPELKFVRKTAILLRKIFYQGKGINQQVYFVATKWNPQTGIYELYYKAEIDFPEQMDDNPVEGVTVKTMEGGVLKLIKSYENTVYEIPLDGSIAENINVSINGLMFQSVFNFNVIPFVFHAPGTVIPIVLMNEQGNDVGVAKQNQSYKEFTPTDTNSIQTNVISTGNYCFNSVRSILHTNPQGGLTVSGYLTFSGSMTTGRLFVQYGDSATNQVDIIPAQSIGATTINFSKEIDAAGGQAVYLCFECDGSSGAEISAGQIYLTFNSQFEDTNCYYLKPEDIFKLLLQKIYLDSGNKEGYPIYYNYQCTLLDQYSNLCLTSGAALRNLAGAKLKISLSKLYEIYNPILKACLGNNNVNQGTAEEIFFEKRESIYDPTNIDFELGEVARLNIKPDYSKFFDVVKIGYAEQKYDNKQGDDEFNTTAQYKAPNKIAKEFNLICAARGDSFGHEYTRFLTGTTQTSNNRGDNDIFITNIDLSQHNNTSVVVNGNTSANPVTSVKYADYNVGIESSTILKWPLLWSDVQGASFKNSFGIVDGLFVNSPNTVGLNYKNSKIQFNNIQAGFTAITGTLSLAGKLDGILIFQYHNPTLFRSTSYSTTKYKTGTYNVRFSLYKNYLNDSNPGTEIGYVVIPVTIGQLFQLNINFSDNLYFGDNYCVLYSLEDTFSQGASFQYLMINGQVSEVLKSGGLTGIFTSAVISLSESNAIPVYGVKRVIYDSVSTGDMLNPQWIYNVEDLTPSRMMDKWGNWFRSIFYNQTAASFKFQSSDKFRDLSTTLNRKTFSEGTDIPIGAMNDNLMFYPFIIEFDTEIPIGAIDLMNKARNAHVHGTYYGIDFYGFPEKISIKPGLNESQTWQLLASPMCDINALTNFDLSGINLLNLQKMSSFIPHSNPVKFYKMGKTQDPRYNFVQMDDDWFQNQIKFWIHQPKIYYQKWQQNDTISLEVFSNAISPATIMVYDDKQNLISSISMDIKTDSAVPSPLILFQKDIPLSTFDEGIYYLVITIGSGSTVDTFISEGLSVKTKQYMTMLFEYSNSINRNYSIFSSGWKPSFRVESWLSDYRPKAHVAAFEDQPANMKILNSINYDQYKLNIGTKYGVPPYIIRLMNWIMGFDTVTADGLSIAKLAEDTEWEEVNVSAHPMKYYNLEIRDAQNEQGVSDITTGTLEDELMTTYNVNMKGFGDFDSSTNTIPIKKVE